jgi:hypothetical protein
VIQRNGPEPAQLAALQIILTKAPSMIQFPKPITAQRGDVNAQALARSLKDFEILLSSIQSRLNVSQLSAALKASLTQAQTLLQQLLEQPQVAFR